MQHSNLEDLQVACVSGYKDTPYSSLKTGYRSPAFAFKKLIAIWHEKKDMTKEFFDQKKFIDADAMFYFIMGGKRNILFAKDHGDHYGPYIKNCLDVQLKKVSGDISRFPKNFFIFIHGSEHNKDPEKNCSDELKKIISSMEENLGLPEDFFKDRVFEFNVTMSNAQNENLKKQLEVIKTNKPLKITDKQQVTTSLITQVSEINPSEAKDIVAILNSLSVNDLEQALTKLQMSESLPANIQSKIITFLTNLRDETTLSNNDMQQQQFAAMSAADAKTMREKIDLIWFMVQQTENSLKTLEAYQQAFEKLCSYIPQDKVQVKLPISFKQAVDLLMENIPQKWKPFLSDQFNPSLSDSLILDDVLDHAKSAERKSEVPLAVVNALLKLKDVISKHTSDAIEWAKVNKSNTAYEVLPFLTDLKKPLEDIKNACNPRSGQISRIFKKKPVEIEGIEKFFRIYEGAYKAIEENKKKPNERDCGK